MTNGNENAYPVISFDQDGRSCEYEQGLSKRELISAMCLQGILASFSNHENIADYATTAKTATDYADALINELNK